MPKVGQGVNLLSAGGMAQVGEWSRLSNQGQAFLRADSFSPDYTLFSVGGMAQGEEWSRFRNQNNYSSLFEKNKAVSPLLMYHRQRLPIYGEWSRTVILLGSHSE